MSGSDYTRMCAHTHTHTHMDTHTRGHTQLACYRSCSFATLSLSSALLVLQIDRLPLSGTVGVLMVAMAVTSALGFYGYLGVKGTLIALEVVPFLVLAVGVDNLFIIVHAYEVGVVGVCVCGGGSVCVCVCVWVCVCVGGGRCVWGCSVKLKMSTSNRCSVPTDPAPSSVNVRRTPICPSTLASAKLSVQLPPVSRSLPSLSQLPFCSGLSPTCQP